MASARIDRPSRFVSVVVPFNADDTTSGGSFWLVSDNGERQPAQVDVVARYADGSIQAAEMSARFSTAPNTVTLDEGEHDDLPAFAWLGGIPQAIRRLSGLEHVRPIRSGHVKRTWRFVNVDGELSMVVWLTAFSGSRCLRYDAVYHNARANASPLAVKGLWIWGTPEFDFWPTTPEPLHLPGMTTIGQSGEFYFPQRGRRIVRGVLAPKDATPDEIREAAHGYGWGAMVSEWNGCEAFTALQLPVPSFGAIDLRGKQTADRQKAWNALAGGTSYPEASYTKSKRLGLWHPCHTLEGGATGGLWITQAPGIDVAASGAVVGMDLAMLEQRMFTDRCHIGLVERDGDPCQLEDYAGTSGWRMRSDDAHFDKAGGKVLDGPFGFSTRPPLPVGLCPEQAELDAFEPIDFGHLIRSLRPSITLAWLANDDISKWLIRQDAELARMSWDGARLASDEQFALAHPSRGMHWQRIQGWQCRVMAEAYALHGQRLRDRFFRTFERILDVAERAVMPNGFIHTTPSGKEFGMAPYSKLFVPAAQHHHGILTSGLHAIWRAIYADAPKLTEQAAEGVRFLLLGKQTLWSAAVRPADVKAEPFTSRQTGSDGLPLDSSHPNYPDGKPTVALTDSEQTRAIVGLYGMAATGAERVEALQLAADMMGPTPTKALLAMGHGVTDSDAILLAFCQKAGLP